MNKNLVIALLISLFASISFSGSVFATDCGEGCSLEQNTEVLNASIANAGKAIEMIKGELAKPEDQRDGKPIAKFLADTILDMKKIVHNKWDAKLQSPKGKMRIAQFRLKKGKFEEAESLLQAAIVKMDKVKDIRQ